MTWNDQRVISLLHLQSFHNKEHAENSNWNLNTKQRRKKIISISLAFYHSTCFNCHHYFWNKQTKQLPLNNMETEMRKKNILLILISFVCQRSDSFWHFILLQDNVLCEFHDATAFNRHISSTTYFSLLLISLFNSNKKKQQHNANQFSLFRSLY